VDLVSGGIEHQVRELQPGLRLLAAVTPNQGVEAREQLLEGEGLDQVVVRAGVEPLHPRRDVGSGGEHQNRRAVPTSSHDLTRLHPVEAGHHQVEDDNVRSVALHETEAFLAVGRQRHVEPAQHERSPECLPDRPLVIHDEDLRPRLVNRDFAHAHWIVHLIPKECAEDCPLGGGSAS
jgi:hypothetical protein